LRCSSGLYVKGLKPQEYFGPYAVNRYDVVWLDK
jgi:hypothetical protein